MSGEQGAKGDKAPTLSWYLPFPLNTVVPYRVVDPHFTYEETRLRKIASFKDYVGVHRMSGTVEMARETTVGRKYSLCPHGAYPPECVQGGPVGGCTGDYRGLPGRT